MCVSVCVCMLVCVCSLMTHCIVRVLSLFCQTVAATTPTLTHIYTCTHIHKYRMVSVVVGRMGEQERSKGRGLVVTN